MRIATLSAVLFLLGAGALCAQQGADAGESQRSAFRAWRSGMVIEHSDAPFVFVAGDVERGSNGRSGVRLSVAGFMKHARMSVRPVRRVDSDGRVSYVAVADSASRMLRIDSAGSELVEEFIDLDLGDSAEAVMLTLEPEGSFGEEHTLQLVLPAGARSPRPMFMAAVASSVRCPKGCFMLQSSCAEPRACNIDHHLVCCRSQVLTVDCEGCTIACREGDWCPVIVIPRAEKGE